MAKNERTSRRVASIAGKVLRNLKMAKDGVLVIAASSVVPGQHVNICTTTDLEALAASALTQAPDKKK